MKPCDNTEVIYHIVQAGRMKQKHYEGHFQHKTVYYYYQIIETVNTQKFKGRGDVYE